MALKAYSVPKPKQNKHNTTERESGKPGSFSFLWYMMRAQSRKTQYLVVANPTNLRNSLYLVFTAKLTVEHFERYGIIKALLGKWR